MGTTPSSASAIARATSNSSMAPQLGRGAEMPRDLFVAEQRRQPRMIEDRNAHARNLPTFRHDALEIEEDSFPVALQMDIEAVERSVGFPLCDERHDEPRLSHQFQGPDLLRWPTPRRRNRAGSADGG